PKTAGTLWNPIARKVCDPLIQHPQLLTHCIVADQPGAHDGTVWGDDELTRCSRKVLSRGIVFKVGDAVNEPIFDHDSFASFPICQIRSVEACFFHASINAGNTDET